MPDAFVIEPLRTPMGAYRGALSGVRPDDLAAQAIGAAVERYLRDARVTTLYEGTSQIQKLIIGRAATGINAMLPFEES